MEWVRGNPEAVNNLLMQHMAITTDRAGQDGVACPENLCPDQQQSSLIAQEKLTALLPNHRGALYTAQNASSERWAS